MLSDSERLRFGVAFQVALAAVTGLRFVVIDRADMLDGPTRSLLYDVLSEAEIDQAIVFATGARVPEEVPEGVKFILLPEAVPVPATAA
jgi:hypothetical protein